MTTEAWFVLKNGAEQGPYKITPGKTDPLKNLPPAILIVGCAQNDNEGTLIAQGEISFLKFYKMNSIGEKRQFTPPADTLITFKDPESILIESRFQNEKIKLLHKKDPARTSIGPIRR